jgi:hypothetical protein
MHLFQRGNQDHRHSPTHAENFLLAGKDTASEPQPSFLYGVQGFMTSRGATFGIYPTIKNRKKQQSSEVAKRQMIEFQIRTLFDVSLVDLKLARYEASIDQIDTVGSLSRSCLIHDVSFDWGWKPNDQDPRGSVLTVHGGPEDFWQHFHVLLVQLMAPDDSRKRRMEEDQRGEQWGPSELRLKIRHLRTDGTARAFLAVF